MDRIVITIASETQAPQAPMDLTLLNVVLFFGTIAVVVAVFDWLDRRNIRNSKDEWHW